MNLSSFELKMPPPLVAAATALLMWAAAWLLPALAITFPGRAPVAAVVALAGLLCAVAGVVEFRRAQTTVSPLKPGNASSLVAGGIYRLTRNPMYLGLALALLGWGLFLANPASIAVIFLFVAYMNRFQIAPEERALESLFGVAFAAYRSKVRRWI